MLTDIQRLNDRIDAKVELLRNELIDLSPRILASPKAALASERAG